MTILELVESIYLGDRGCKAVLIDYERREVRIQIDCISRIRGDKWDFYNDENLEDGFLVFEDVQSIRFEPQGFMINDFIGEFRVEELQEENVKFKFIFVAGSYSNGQHADVAIEILANSFALQDCKGSDQYIRD